MPAGPGKYDDECTRVREATGAKGVVLIIFEGDKGSGFSVQAGFVEHLFLPETLESIAREMRAARESANWQPGDAGNRTPDASA